MTRSPEPADAPRDVAPLDVLLTALAFGLLAGAVEVALWLARTRAGVGVEVRVYGSHFGWMSPVANAVVLVTAAGVFLAVRRLAGALPTFAHACFAFAFLTAFGPLFTFHPRLHKAAGMLLALGLASVVARVADRHPGRVVRLARTLAIVLLLLPLVALGLVELPRAAGRRALERLPPAAPGLPSVLLITLDTVAAQHMSLHGYHRPTTPRLERIGSRGVVFERALAPTSWTLPAHASLFTGRQPGELSAGWQSPLDAAHATLAEVLSSHGYATAGFVANVAYCSRAHGLARGFMHYDDHPISPGQLAESTALARFVTDSTTIRRVVRFYDLLGRKSAEDINSAVLQWIGRNRRPFFAFVNYFDAHDPYVPPPSYAAAFGVEWDRKVIQSRLVDTWSADQASVERNAYDAALSHLDDQVGRLIEALQDAGLLDQMLVIITSDHGEEFLEHGVMGHGESLYLKSLHVPLLMVWPNRIPEGRRVAEPVSLSDVGATILDLAGIRPERPFPGQSLAALWSVQPPADRARPWPAVLGELAYAANRPPHYPVSKGDMVSIVSHPYHYIRRGDGVEELYDIEADLAETRNLAGSREMEPVLLHARTLVDRASSR